MTSLSDARDAAMSSTFNPKFDEEFRKEAPKSGGHAKDKAAKEKPAEEKGFWFLSLMSHMTHTNIFTELSTHSQEQTIIEGVAAMKTTHEEAANCFFSLISLQKMLAKCLRCSRFRKRRMLRPRKRRRRETS